MKRDALGRVKTDAVRRDAILDEFERSGLSGVKFAAVAGIKYATLASWVQRRKRDRAARGRRGVRRKADADGAVPLPALGWVEAQVERRAASSPGNLALRVLLPGGAILEIADEGQALLAAGLLRAMRVSASGVAC
jgi:hypothetical protein